MVGVSLPENLPVRFTDPAGSDKNSEMGEPNGFTLVNPSATVTPTMPMHVNLYDRTAGKLCEWIGFCSLEWIGFVALGWVFRLFAPFLPNKAHFRLREEVKRKKEADSVCKMLANSQWTVFPVRSFISFFSYSSWQEWTDSWTGSPALDAREGSFLANEHNFNLCTNKFLQRMHVHV